MVSQQKGFMVANLTEKIAQAKGLVLANYQGLGVEQLGGLRNELKESGAEFEVVKNTLISLAAKEKNFPLKLEDIAGPTIALWIYEDNPKALKILFNFIKKNEIPKVKIGFWDKENIDQETLKELASLPGREELRAKVVGSLSAPLFGLTYSLKWNLNQLVYTLDAVRNKKNYTSGGASTPGV